MAMRDEYLDMFPHLNRVAVKVRFKKVVYDWVNECEPGDPVDPEKERIDDGGVYLLPNLPLESDWEPWLKKNYMKIFEQELWGWERDDEKWPKDRSWEKFREFFEYSFNSGVLDLAHEEDIYND
jgi:hypothetical protein